MRNFCFEEKESVLKKLKTRESGLSDAEAAERLKIYGKNGIESGKNAGVIKLFLSQFSDFMTVLLMVAAAVSGIIAFVSRDRSDLTDTLIILSIIFLNALVGAIQQFRADKAIENLKKLSANTCKVRRGGKEKVIPGEELTVGDIILLEEGDVIPADCRILYENSLKCDEAALTGESAGVEKNSRRIAAAKVSLGGMTNSLFGSTYVISGNCTAVVTAVGMATEMGKIAEMLKGEKPRKTPLENSLAKLGKIITFCVLAISALIFFIGVFVRGGGILKNFMTAVAIAVAAIPEGLPAVVTIIMAMGVQRMSKKNVVIRKLKSVETLGGCSVICTDKTGTLTQNKLKVTKVWSLDGQTEESAGRKLLQCMTACSAVKGERGEYIGDPTEVALRLYADGAGFSEQMKKLAEIPFTSERKMMSVAVETAEGNFTFTKGAPDILLKKCAYAADGKGVRPLTAGDRQSILSANGEMADGALRVLAFAYSPYGGKIEEDGLVFIALCGMYDGLKPGVAEAVEECRSAGITTVMITGDHVRTALSVARQLKIASDISEVATGEELDGLSKSEREKRISECRVFARVSPKHKNMIVKCLKKRGKVVAMTGDGINDAPGIKSADIGISMGIYGTDVTKSASDMIITDDNFATIVSAVREGRRISENIKKTIQFFISTNLAEVLAIFVASVFFFRYDFLLSTQLLWLNLITDSFPVLALGTEKEGADIMKKPPVRAEKSLFSKTSVAGIAYAGVYITAVTVAVYAAALHLWGNAVATTMTFLTISFAELFHAFNIRSERSSALKDFFGNRILVLTVAAGIVLNVLLCVTPLSRAFALTPLTGGQWGIAAAASLSVIPAFELFKLISALIRRRGKSGGR